MYKSKWHFYYKMTIKWGTWETMPQFCELKTRLECIWWWEDYYKPSHTSFTPTTFLLKMVTSLNTFIHHSSYKRRSFTHRWLQTGRVIPGPRVVVDDFFKRRRGDEFCSMLIARELHDFKYVEVTNSATGKHVIIFRVGSYVEPFIGYFIVNTNQLILLKTHKKICN